MTVLEQLAVYAQSARTALISREEHLTFRRLEEKSNAFAAWLLENLGDDRSPVVICGDKETDFLCCIFGALKSGRAYVPIDSVVPDERAGQIIESVNPKVIIDFTGRELYCSAKVLDSGETAEILNLPPSEPVPRKCWVSGDDTVYILFTSGSTGRPKGVPITAKNLEAFCQGVFPFYPQDGGVILHQVSYSFDVSGCSVYAGLSRGMTLFTVDHKMSADFGELFSQLRESGLTMWVSTPSFAELCIQSKSFSKELLPELKQFLFCGESLTCTLCSGLSERFPSARIRNTYGPTEATVLVTAAEITPEMCSGSQPVPIGSPIDGVVLKLADPSGQEILEEGKTGQLLILGESVSAGYFGQQLLTKKSFFTDRETGLRGYRTGDLCYCKDNLYYYCGRADNQLKLNGYRIELEDVEANLEKIPNIQRAAAVPVMEGEKVQYLAAFLLLREPDGMTPLRRSIYLKKQAAAYLPAYMIPRRLFAVDRFPLNVNGKIDKKALAARLMEGRI